MGNIGIITNNEYIKIEDKAIYNTNLFTEIINEGNLESLNENENHLSDKIHIIYIICYFY